MNTTTLRQAKHTPTPWKIDSLTPSADNEITISRSWENGGASVCIVESSRNAETLRADAQRIIHCVNTYEQMIQALEKLLSRAVALDQSVTHDGLQNCDAIAQARNAILAAKKIQP